MNSKDKFDPRNGPLEMKIHQKKKMTASLKLTLVIIMSTIALLFLYFGFDFLLKFINNSVNSYSYKERAKKINKNKNNINMWFVTIL